jgi:hypothetical protein
LKLGNTDCSGGGLKPEEYLNHAQLRDRGEKCDLKRGALAYLNIVDFYTLQDIGKNTFK